MKAKSSLNLYKNMNKTAKSFSQAFGTSLDVTKAKMKFDDICKQTYSPDPSLFVQPGIASVVFCLSLSKAAVCFNVAITTDFHNN